MMKKKIPGVGLAYFTRLQCDRTVRYTLMDKYDTIYVYTSKCIYIRTGISLLINNTSELKIGCAQYYTLYMLYIFYGSWQIYILRGMPGLLSRTKLYLYEYRSMV